MHYDHDMTVIAINQNFVLVEGNHMTFKYVSRSI